MIEDSTLKKYEGVGFEKGKAEGKSEEKLQSAKAMKEKGMHVALIAECTGLDAEAIDKL